MKTLAFAPLLAISCGWESADFWPPGGTKEMLHGRWSVNAPEYEAGLWIRENGVVYPSGFLGIGYDGDLIAMGRYSVSGQTIVIEYFDETGGTEVHTQNWVVTPTTLALGSGVLVPIVREPIVTGKPISGTWQSLYRKEIYDAQRRLKSSSLRNSELSVREDGTVSENVVWTQAAFVSGGTVTSARSDGTIEDVGAGRFRLTFTSDPMPRQIYLTRIDGIFFAPDSQVFTRIE